MINPDSRSLKWITEAAHKAGVRDAILVEKTIRGCSRTPSGVRANNKVFFVRIFGRCCLTS